MTSVPAPEALKQLMEYVQHKPWCPQSLPNVKLDFGAGWVSQTSYIAPCNCGLAALLAASPIPSYGVQDIAAIAWRCIKQCRDHTGPPVMCVKHQLEAEALLAAPLMAEKDICPGYICPICYHEKDRCSHCDRPSDTPQETQP